MFKSSQLCARLLHGNIDDINSLPEILSASSKQVLKSPSLSSIPWSHSSGQRKGPEMQGVGVHVGRIPLNPDLEARP